MTPWRMEGEVRLAGECLVEPFNLTLEPGWTCLLGPSGSGKSTLLRLLAGLETGADFVGSLSVPDRIGWMAQTDLMQPRLSIEQNVVLLDRLAGRPADRDRARHILAQVGLEGYASDYPDQLSGGQRQRVALARTLMSDADLVLLDEPFSALDPATRANMQELTYKAFEGRPVVLVTHDPAEALRLGSTVRLLSHRRLQAISGLTGGRPHDLSNPALAAASAALLSRIRGEQDGLGVKA